jgi:light-regulated signal transduction histidine kinase (bacteriophytochrome)
MTKVIGCLIEELLRFSRLSRVTITGSEIDLNELVEIVIGELKPDIGERRIIWKRGKLPRVQADRMLLQQVFVNLISNALKYTRPREAAEIELGFQENNDETILFVRDNGVGFDPRYADKLLASFSACTGKKSSKEPGSDWPMCSESSYGTGAGYVQMQYPTRASFFISACQRHGC